MYKLEIFVHHKDDGMMTDTNIYMELNEDVNVLRNMAKAYMEDKATISAINSLFKPDYLIIELSELNTKNAFWETIFHSAEFI